jgi:dihydrofolate reductase
VRTNYPISASKLDNGLRPGFLAHSTQGDYTNLIGRPAIKLSVFCGVSVDGFLARPDDALDFLDTGGQEPHGFEEFFDSVDVVVIGRRTFEVVQKLGHFALYGKKPVVVLSSRPLDFSLVKGGTLLQMSGEPTEIVRQLKGRAFQHAYVDGGITIQRFLTAGCINRMVITRVPVLIGEGIPLFGRVPRDVALRHVATRSYPDGLVQSEYEVGAKETS